MAYCDYEQPYVMGQWFEYSCQFLSLVAIPSMLLLENLEADWLQYSFPIVYLLQLLMSSLSLSAGKLA